MSDQDDDFTTGNPMDGFTLGDLDPIQPEQLLSVTGLFDGISTDQRMRFLALFCACIRGVDRAMPFVDDYYNWIRNGKKPQ